MEKRKVKTKELPKGEYINKEEGLVHTQVFCSSVGNEFECKLKTGDGVWMGTSRDLVLLAQSVEKRI